MQFASISARRRNADPQPYLLPDGTRSATDPVDMGNPEHWVTDADGAAVSLRRDLGTYAPRPEFSPTLHNPVNPILDSARDSFDSGDAWGWAMGWAFPVCAALTALEAPVPEEMGYAPSILGPEGDLREATYEACEVVALTNLGIVDNVFAEPTVFLAVDTMPVAEQHRAIDMLTHAARVLSRYLDACKSAGLDY